MQAGFSFQIDGLPFLLCLQVQQGDRDIFVNAALIVVGGPDLSA
jgi:hypothetical protein